jgi:transcriptional regulator with XRE-family HTH domain
VYVELYPERVRTLREEQGISKRDLAAAAGISTTTARNAECGESVRSKTARKVAAALGVNPLQRLGRPARRA